MRIKKVPLRASGMEGTTICSSVGEAPDVSTVTANLKTEKSSDFQNCSVSVQHGRAAGERKEVLAAQRDEETQAAKAKLRQYEAMGHIKVEMDEVSCAPPTLAQACTAFPSIVVNLRPHSHPVCRLALSVLILNGNYYALNYCSVVVAEGFQCHSPCA